MRINAHAHVFNLRTVLTPKAVRIIVSRLSEHGLPTVVTEAVGKLLAEQVINPEHLTEDELARKLLGYIGSNTGFSAFIRSRTSVVPPELLDLSGEVVRELPRDDLWSAFDNLTTLADGPAGGTRAKVFNLYETLRIALRPSVLAVADDLLSNHGPDDVVVALMMDITAEADGELDRRLFERQLRETGDLIVQRPGRVLPFVAVNPRRPGHYEIMTRALESQAFVGVKLYPSLGYEIDTPALRKVFEYCERNDVPILTHCTDSGFYEAENTKALADPRLWKPILGAYPALRVCFAHCGGATNFSAVPVAGEESWADVVIQLMGEYDGVCADIGLHVQMMGNGEMEQRYFDRLHSLLADNATRERMLFGSDWWLLRLQTTEGQFWRYFTDRLSAAELHAMSVRAPARFLGLPVDGLQARPNVSGYLERIRESAASVGAPPAAWVRGALGTPGAPVQFHVRRVAADWTPNQVAHVQTWKGLVQAKLVPRRLEDTPFEEGGFFYMRQLEHWTKPFESASQFQRRCRAAGRSLAQYCVRIVGAGYEGSYSGGSAIDALTEAFSDGDLTVAGLAAVADSVFRFQGES